MTLTQVIEILLGMSRHPHTVVKEFHIRSQRSQSNCDDLLVNGRFMLEQFRFPVDVDDIIESLERLPINPKNTCGNCGFEGHFTLKTQVEIVGSEVILLSKLKWKLWVRRLFYSQHSSRMWIWRSVYSQYSQVKIVGSEVTLLSTLSSRLTIIHLQCLCLVIVQ